MLFLTESGATHSVVTSCKGPLSKTVVLITGAMGKRTLRSFLQPMEYVIGDIKLTCEFLYMPECSFPLLGRNLLCKLNAQITFSENSVQLHIPQETAWRAQLCLLMNEISEEPGDNVLDMVLDAIIPLVWDSKMPGKVKNVITIKIKLKTGPGPIKVTQYPVRLEARKGLGPLIKGFMLYGLHRECQSEFSTPILPVKKPHCQEYRLVQDVRAINQTFILLSWI